MRVDARTQFSNAQAVTATAISTDVLNLKGNGFNPNTVRNIGCPSGGYLVITVGTAATAAGAATVTFTLESAADAGLTSGAVVHAATGAIGKADLTAGSVAAVIPLPKGDYKQYLGVRYTVATGPLTAGTFNAQIVNEPPTWKAYEDGVAG